jgi:cysteine-rich repeat protein
MRTLYALLWLVVAFNCVQSQAVPCGDILCPSGSVCTESGQCAFVVDIASCVGKADGDSCEARGGDIGVCSTGACSVGQCGNGRVDGGEACDDGNRSGADGCAADCSKLEVCGDAVADEGEACDDGNSNAVDGCDGCKLTQWSASPVVGGPIKAIDAGLGRPQSVAVDVHGNVYIADSDKQRLWRVDSNGMISTVAGTGTAGYNGDGRAATSAQLDSPFGVAVDGVGNVYIVERESHRVRRVDLDGIISTLAGTGTPGYNGDGIAATSAQLASPSGVAVDGLGNVYIADRDNQRIRRVDNNGTITTMAGTGTPGYNGDAMTATSAHLAYPFAVAVDQMGNVYIADRDNRRIRRVDTNGTISTVAGTGAAGYNGDDIPATSARIGSPRGVAVDVLGNVYFTDRSSQRVRRVDSSGMISTVAGTGTVGYNGDNMAATSAQVALPYGVTVDRRGNVYIADRDNRRIRRVDTLGIITTVAGTGTTENTEHDLSATRAQLAYPSGVAVDQLDNLYIADSDNNWIRRVDTNGVLSIVAGTGIRGYNGDGIGATSARLRSPSSVAVDRNGNVYIADTGNHRVRRVDSNGMIRTVAGTGISGYSGDGMAAISAQIAEPVGVAVDGMGNVFIAESHRIRQIDPDGTISTVAGTETRGYNGDGMAATSAQLDSPSGVALDSLGNLYIADSNNNRIRRVDRNGMISTVVGTGVRGYNGDAMAATSAQLAYPKGIEVDPVGNLYIIDSWNNRLRRVDNTGMISTVAGTGTPDYGGDRAAATLAQLSYPQGVALDAVGSAYIADASNARIRRVDGTTGTITTYVGGSQLGGSATSVRVENTVALVTTRLGALFLATGANGIVARVSDDKIESVAGRDPQISASGNLARFRDRNFGSVGGVAWDESAQLFYLTESSPTSSRVWAVTPVDPDKPDTWTIAPLVNDPGTAGFADGAAATTRLRNPTGLWLDAATSTLYIADTGNHAIRALDLNSKTVTTVVNSKHSLGFAGDGAAAIGALLYQPQALTKCGNGDLFIADTGNNRIRRVAAGTGIISTVVGDGVPASSGQGAPATIFPVDNPLGVACDGGNNLFISSSTTVRLLPASPAGIVDGSGSVQTIYGAAPRNAFPASETSCLTGIITPTATTLQVADSCSGLVVELTRTSADM